MTDRLTEIKARRAKATQGEWEDSDFNIVRTNSRLICRADYYADSAFIAAAPSDIDWLIAEVERLLYKCGESCPEGETINYILGSMDTAICPLCGAETEDPWDYPPAPGYEPNNDNPDYWTLIECHNCGWNFEAALMGADCFVRARIAGGGTNA